MQKILAINGSPRGKTGATWWVLERFIKGIEETGEKVTAIHLAGKKIHPCSGDLSCWTKTPGKCIHNDDMKDILPLLGESDSVIFATPVYVDGMTGLLKNCIDRLVPSVDPHVDLRDGHFRHPFRSGPAGKRIALVSVCGFYELDNFEPLVAHVKAICRNMNAEYAGAVLRPAAPMLPEIPTIHPLFFKMRNLTKLIEQAGGEFARTGKLSEKTQTAVSTTEIVSRDEYRKMLNHYFDEALKKLK